MVRPVRSACRSLAVAIEPVERGGGHAECLRDRPEGQCREEGERGDEDDGAADQDAEQRRRWVGSVPAPGSTRFCAASDPASASTARIGTNRPNSIASAEGGLEERAGHGEPGEGAAVVVGRRGVGVEHLGQAVRHRCWPARRRARRGSASAAPVPSSTRVGMARMRDRRGVISRRPSFLPRYSGVRPTISPARNTATTASTRIRTGRRRPRRARPRRAACSAARPRRPRRCSCRAAS